MHKFVLNSLPCRPRCFRRLESYSCLERKAKILICCFYSDVYFNIAKRGRERVVFRWRCGKSERDPVAQAQKLKWLLPKILCPFEGPYRPSSTLYVLCKVPSRIVRISRKLDNFSRTLTPLKSLEALFSDKRFIEKGSGNDPSRSISGKTNNPCSSYLWTFLPRLSVISLQTRDHLLYLFRVTSSLYLQ